MTESQVLPILVQGGSFAALCYVIYWATQKLVPILERIQTTMQEMQLSYFEKLDERDKFFHVQLTDITAQYQKNCDDCRLLWRQLVESPPASERR